MGTEDPKRDDGNQARPARPAGRSRRPFLQRVFVENLGLKVIAMIIALALFVLVREDKGKEADVEIAVVLSNLDESAVFVGELPRTMRVRVKDRWSRLARALERKPNPYLVDLRGFADGSMYVFDRDRIRQLLGVSGLSIQSVYPADFAVALEPKVERVVTVKPNFVGEPPEGYVVAKDRAKVTPAQVRIWGARSSLKGVDELLTWPVDLATLEKDARLEVQVQKPAAPFLFLDDERVRVDVPVQELQGREVLGRQDVIVKDCPESLACTVDPGAVSVTLTGPMPTLLKIKRGTLPIEVIVDAVDFDPTVVRHDGIRPTCQRPAGVDCAMSPRSVLLMLAPPGDERRSTRGR